MDYGYKSQTGHTGLAWLVDGLVCLDHKHPTGVPVEADEFLVHKQLPQVRADSEVKHIVSEFIVAGKLEYTDRHTDCNSISGEQMVPEVPFRKRTLN